MGGVVDKERLVHLGEEYLRIGPGYIKLDGSTVHLTGNEHLLLCAISDACPNGLAVADIAIHLNSHASNNVSSLVNSHIHTTRKKIVSLSKGKVSIQWNRKTREYHLIIL
jgi:hypothetical protein